MIILGIILLVVGALTDLSFLYAIGGLLVVIGIVLTVLGFLGRAVGGRKTYF